MENAPLISAWLAMMAAHVASTTCRVQARQQDHVIKSDHIDDQDMQHLLQVQARPAKS
jgi:hypothetical protein